MWFNFCDLFYKTLQFLNHEDHSNFKNLDQMQLVWLIDWLIDWLRLWLTPQAYWTIVINLEFFPNHTCSLWSLRGSFILWIIVIKLEFFPNHTCSHWSLWGYMTSNVFKWFYDVITVNCSRECWPMTVVPHERSMIENGGMMTHILNIAVFCTFMSFFK